MSNDLGWGFNESSDAIPKPKNEEFPLTGTIKATVQKEDKKTLPLPLDDREYDDEGYEILPTETPPKFLPASSGSKSGRVVATGGTWGGQGFMRCFHTHPALKFNITVPGCPEGSEQMEVQIWGGNGRDPVVKDADIYVGLDGGVSGYGNQPWNGSTVQDYLYTIQDMNAPKNPEDFRLFIHWLSVQLIAGKKVHVGCIGGHGRTGTVFAALVAYMTTREQIPDPITYVRKNYCTKAVEAKVQVEFLVKYFGCVQVAGAKEVAAAPWAGTATSTTKWTSNQSYVTKGKPHTQLGSDSSFGKAKKGATFAKAQRVIDPVANEFSIW